MTIKKAHEKWLETESGSRVRSDSGNWHHGIFIFTSRSGFKITSAGLPWHFFGLFTFECDLDLADTGSSLYLGDGGDFQPFLRALAAGSGATLGELTGYLVGFSGQGVVENKKWYDRISRWMLKYGDLTIFLLALIPNPFFDIAGMVAGALKMPLWRFLLWVWLGKCLKMLAFALGGAGIAGLFTSH